MSINYSSSIRNYFLGIGFWDDVVPAYVAFELFRCGHSFSDDAIRAVSALQI